MSNLSIAAAPITTSTQVNSKSKPVALTVITMMFAGLMVTGCSTTPTVKPTATVIMGAHTSL